MACWAPAAFALPPFPPWSPGRARFEQRVTSESARRRHLAMARILTCRPDPAGWTVSALATRRAQGLTRGGRI